MVLLHPKAVGFHIHNHFPVVFGFSADKCIKVSKYMEEPLTISVCESGKMAAVSEHIMIFMEYAGSSFSYHDRLVQV